MIHINDRLGLQTIVCATAEDSHNANYCNLAGQELCPVYTKKLARVFNVVLVVLQRIQAPTLTDTGPALQHADIPLPVR